MLYTRDYMPGTRTCMADGKSEPMELKGQNVMYYELEGGTTFIIRPSGTEPKIKTYFTTLGKTLEEAQAQKDALAAAIEPIQTLKTNYLGGKNPRLHTDEILIALSSSAASSELAAAAMHQLPNLKGCDVHSTVLLSSVDSSTLNRLGMYLTCDPVYEEEDRKYHKR